MKRRALLGALAFALVSAPCTSYPQVSPAKRYRVGFLGAESAQYDAWRLRSLRSGLLDLGYDERRNLTIDARFADGDYERLTALATELVRLGVDVIVTSGSKAGVGASRATTRVPIVVSNMGDAINAGVVGGYGQPRTNVTGMSLLNPEVLPKQLEILKEIKPRLAAVAMLHNPANPNSSLVVEVAKRQADAMKLALELFGVRGPDEFAGAFSEMRKRRVDALLVSSDTMFGAYGKRIAALALENGMPSAGNIDYARNGGLLAYAADRAQAWAHAIGYVDKILRGAHPADLPVEQPTKVELIINLKTAKSLGLTIPQALVLRADEVIR